MLDVHPAHHAASTWRDFFIHIATIVIGLLIAIGLEQTVEYFHHRNQVEETRAALRVERQVNVARFAAQGEEFHRILPVLETNLAVFKFLQQHPAAPPDRWPGKLHWWLFTFAYYDAAWKTAIQNNVIAYMPGPEVQSDARLYAELNKLSDDMLQERKALREAGSFSTSEPDPAKLSREQTDIQVQLMIALINDFLATASDQNVLSAVYTDFTGAPTQAEVASFRHHAIYPEDFQAVQAEIDKVRAADRAAKLSVSAAEEDK